MASIDSSATVNIPTPSEDPASDGSNDTSHHQASSQSQTPQTESLPSQDAPTSPTSITIQEQQEPTSPPPPAAATAAASEGGGGGSGVRAKIGKHLQNASAFAKWMINGQGAGTPSPQDVASRAFQNIVRSVMPKTSDGKHPDLGEITRSPAFVSLRAVSIIHEAQLFQIILKLLLESKRRLKSQDATLQQFNEQQQQLKQPSTGDPSSGAVSPTGAGEPEGSSSRSKKRNSKKEMKKQQKALELAAAAAAAMPLEPEITEQERAVLESFHAKAQESGSSMFLEYQGIFSEMLDLVTQARMKLEKREKGNYNDMQFTEQYLHCIGKLEKQARKFRAAAIANSGLNLESLFGGSGGAMSAVTEQPAPPDDDEAEETTPTAGGASTSSSVTTAPVTTTTSNNNNLGVANSSSGSSSGGDSSSGDEQGNRADPEKTSNGKNKQASEKESQNFADSFKEKVQFRMKLLTVLAPVAVRCQGLQPYTQLTMVHVLMAKPPIVSLPDTANTVQYAVLEFMSRLSFTIFQILRSCALNSPPEPTSPSSAAASPSSSTVGGPSVPEKDNAIASATTASSTTQTSVHNDEASECLVPLSPEPPSGSGSASSLPVSSADPSAPSSSSTAQTPPPPPPQSSAETDAEFLAKVQKEASIGLIVMLKRVEIALATDRPNGVNRFPASDDQVVQLQIRQAVEDLKVQLKEGLAHTVRQCLQRATEPHEAAVRRIVERLVEIASGKPVTDPTDIRRLNNLFEFCRIYPDKTCLVHLLVEVFRCAFNVGKIAKSKKMDLKEAEDLRIASLRRNEAEGNDDVIRIVLEFVPTLYPISFACLDVSKDMHLALTKARDNDKSGIKDIAMRRRIKRNTLSNTISQCVIKLGELSAQLYIYTHNGGDFLSPEECLAKAHDSVAEWIQFCEEIAFAGTAPKESNNNDPGSDSASTDNPNDENDGSIIDIGTNSSNTIRVASKDADSADTTTSSGKKAAKKKKNKGKGKQKKQ